MHIVSNVGGDTSSQTSRELLHHKCRQLVSQQFIFGEDWRDQLATLLRSLGTFLGESALLQSTQAEERLVKKYEKYTTVNLSGSDVVTDLLSILYQK